MQLAATCTCSDQKSPGSTACSESLPPPPELFDDGEEEEEEDVGAGADWAGVDCCELTVGAGDRCVVDGAETAGELGTPGCASFAAGR